jgi:2-methylcitrate dehydratase PrpD
MSTQSELISHIAHLRYEALPASVVEATKRSVLDTLAVLIAGSTEEVISKLVALAKGWGGKEECSVAVYGGKVPAPTAALVNCSMARARDLDEVHYGGGGHLGATLVPSAFTIAEYCKLVKQRAVHGKDFIAALAMAADLLCRIPRSYTQGLLTDKGWVSETLAPLPVAALGGKLLGFAETQIRDAMGLAYARMCGNAQVYKEGAYTGMLQNGFAGEGGVLATVLADHGFEGPAEVLEGKFGLFPLYLGGNHSPELFLAGLGKRFEGENVSTKLYPVYGGCQGAIYACLELAAKHDIKAEDVRVLTISTSSHMKESFGSDKKRSPGSVPDALFSLYYGPAVSLLQRRIWFDDFTEEAIKRPPVLEMSRRINVVADPEKDALGVLIPPTDVEIETRDGHTYKMSVPIMPGHPKKPLSWPDLSKKLKDCAPWSAKPLSKRTIDRISEMVEHLETVDDVTAVLEQLT